jgi:putative endonuclease
VFCEVKTRSSAAFGSPALAVGTAKQRRLRATAARWLRTHRARPNGIRFDVAAVVGEEVVVIEGAF